VKGDFLKPRSCFVSRADGDGFRYRHLFYGTVDSLDDDVKISDDDPDAFEDVEFRGLSLTDSDHTSTTFSYFPLINIR
jgi:hypothetical protein